MGIDQGGRRGKHDELTQLIIGVFYEVYNELGFGFLESVYREVMRIALTQAGLNIKTEVPVPVSFRGEVIGVFRADLIVNELVLIELKTCDGILRQHEAQTLHYLKAARIEVALLMNFGNAPSFKRLILDNDLKMAKQKSAASVKIGVRPLTVPKVIL